MNAHLKKLWDCWVAAREHRKPYWKTWLRLLGQTPMIREQVEDGPHYRIYKQLIDSGCYKSEPLPRGRWINGQWVMFPRPN